MQRRPDRFFVDVSRSTASIMQRTINSYAVLRPLDRQEFQWIRDPRVPGSRTNSILKGGGQRGWVVEGSFFSLFPFFLFSSLSLSLSNGARGHIRGGSWTKTVRNVAYFSSHRGVSISGETSTGSNIASLPTPPRRPTSLPLLQITRVFPREDCESVREENSSRRGVVEYPCVRV